MCVVMGNGNYLCLVTGVWNKIRIDGSIYDFPLVCGGECVWLLDI
jgi:hypothetical protein